MASPLRSKVSRGFAQPTVGRTVARNSKSASRLKEAVLRVQRASRNDRSNSWGSDVLTADGTDEKALDRSIERLLAKLDKKKGKARLAKPSKKTLWSSWDGIRIVVTPLVGDDNGTRPIRRKYAMTRKQIAARLAK